MKNIMTTAKLYTALVLSAAVPAAWACSAVPPHWALMSEYGKQGGMSRKEWLNLPRGMNYVLRVPNTAQVFAELDRNRNGRLGMEELEDMVDYVRHPCAWWEEEVARMAREAEAAERKGVRSQ